MAKRPIAPRLPVREEDVQAGIVAGLTALRYTVLQTSRRNHVHRCPKCSENFRDHRGDGASKGVPDLVVSHPAWPEGTWLGLEVKGPQTRVSPEQKSLADAGRIRVVRSIAEALEFVKRQDAVLRGLARELEERLAGGH